MIQRNLLFNIVCLLALALNSAGADDSLNAFFGSQAAAWKIVSGKANIERDSTLGADVLTVVTNTPLVLEGQTRYSDGRIRARVRLRTGGAPNAAAYFNFGVTNATDGGFVLALVGSTDGNLIGASVSEHGHAFNDAAALTDKLNWSSPVTDSMNYYLRAYPQILPGWEENYRAQIEDAMARLPDLENKWVDVRLEFRKGLVRMWVDDRLVATKEDPALDPAGQLKLNLSPGMQLASYVVEPMTEPTGFLPIELVNYANARAFLGKASIDPKSLPPAGKLATVEGIPFAFAGVNSEGNDHIDVGQSFLRQANEKGYLQTYGPNGRWNGATWRDPARIQVRIPNDRYDNLYVIAASDGEENSVPIVSAMFYRPEAGFAESMETLVPLATAASSDAKPLPVVLSDGKKARLWLVKIPLDREKLTAFSDMNLIEIEFTKKVHLYRSYPDPISYGYHQGGPPSGVHIYAATLSRSPVVFDWQADRFGHVWTSPEIAAYTATVSNRSPAEVAGKLTVTTRSFDGTEETRQESPIKVPAGQMFQAKFSCPVKLNGYHDITATLVIDGRKWAEKRSFVRLAADMRSAKWTEGKGGLFRWWSYMGGHHTPKPEHHVRLMTLAGARTEPATMGNPWFVSPQPWAAEDKPDPAKVAEFKASIVKQLQDHEAKLPPEKRADDLYCYPEPGISTRLTAGNYPEYWNNPPFVYTDEEKQSLKMFMGTSRLAAETYRAAYPGRKILIPWGDPLFIVPLLRAGFPKTLFDGSALDIPGFERIPERQLHEQSIHRLYELKKEYEKAGMPNPRLQFNEGIFVPTEPGLVSWREQMDIYHRWTLLSMAHGVTRFYSGWFAFDCGNYYGAEHYGGCGIQRRIPYCDPKPAYAAYATMTDKLNEANFDGWIKTGSLTTYCLRFKHDTRGTIYALWTLRGKRPVTLTLTTDAKAGVTDSMNNTKELGSQDKKLTIVTDPSVIYVTGAGEVSSVTLGEPDNSDNVPATDAKLIADLGDGSWKYTSRRDEVYEKNHWGISPAAGKFSATVAEDPTYPSPSLSPNPESLRGKRGRGTSSSSSGSPASSSPLGGEDKGEGNRAQPSKVLVSKLEKQDQSRELMPWYNTLTPARPIRLDGTPSHLGLWVKGNSDWGRVIYILRDAKGERWISIGTKDDYNCDDPHSWSSFNFDGWRYLRFEMPGHEGWDSFRKHGTTWWGSSAKAVSSPTGKPDGDEIVDLPLSLEQIIVEQRTHILYVNDVQPVAGDTVSFGKLYVEYETPEDASARSVELSRLRMPRPKTPDLPNAIARLTKEGVGAPTKLVKLTAPTHYYDGTRMHVQFAEVPGAKKYNLWVGAYEDGRGAVNLVPAGIANNQLVTGLRPGVKLYYWITYTDANDKESKPSPVHAEVTVDNFKEK